MWVGLLIFLHFFFTFPSLQVSVGFSAFQAEHSCQRKQAVRENQTQSPEGPQLDNKMGWTGSQLVKRSPLILYTKVCADLAMVLLPVTRFSPPVFPSPSSSVLGLVLDLQGVQGRGFIAEWIWDWGKINLPTNPCSYF